MPAETNGTAAAVPSDWFVRVAFDRLLDPTIEDLIPELDDNNMPTGVVRGSFEKTQPVTLTCGGNTVAYDGYYVPNGNGVSWPVGPALFIQPLDSTDAETGASCEVTILDKVHSKTGDSVPSGERTFKFVIRGMELLSTEPDPADADPDEPLGSIEQDADAPVTYTWTASIGTPPAAAEIKIWEATNLAGEAPADICKGGGTLVAAANIKAETNADDDTTFDLGVLDGVTAGKPSWKANTTYRVEFTPNAAVTPAQGGPAGKLPAPADYSLCFHTPAA